MNPFDANLADFFMGHDTDPLKAPSDFLAWKNSAPELHALMERTLSSAADAHTQIRLADQDKSVINMASLDYLGICLLPEAIEAQKEALDKWGNGACGVPLLSGMTTVHRELQNEMSSLTKQSGSILFTSGFAGAIGVCSALFHRGDVVVLDAHAHMSWVDGVRMSGAKLVTFDHNDPNDLAVKLERHKTSRTAVVVDGLYSMDGDLADLPNLLDVCESFDVGMIVDEAHSIFGLGPEGGGATAHFGVQDRVSILFGTFSKALSVVGAFASGDADLIDYIRYYGHPYVFSAAMPPATAAGILAAVKFARPADSLREKLSHNAAYFRDALRARNFDIGESATYVVPVIVGSDRELLYRGTNDLMMSGLFVAPVDYPAVAEDRIRIRCAVTASHTKEDLDQAVRLIGEVFEGATKR